MLLPRLSGVGAERLEGDELSGKATGRQGSPRLGHPFGGRGGHSAFVNPQGVAGMARALAQRVRPQERLVSLQRLHRNSEGQAALVGRPHEDPSRGLRRGLGNCLGVGLGDWDENRKSPSVWAGFF
jgi:hypothetical protein